MNSKSARIATSENINPVNSADKLLKTITGKVLCANCGNFYHSPKFKTCFDCYSKAPARVTQYDDKKRFDAFVESKEI